MFDIKGIRLVDMTFSCGYLLVSHLESGADWSTPAFSIPTFSAAPLVVLYDTIFSNTAELRF